MTPLKYAINSRYTIFRQGSMYILVTGTCQCEPYFSITFWKYDSFWLVFHRYPATCVA